MPWIDELLAKQKKRQTLLEQYEKKRAERLAPRQVRFNPFRDDLPPPPQPPPPEGAGNGLDELLGLRGRTPTALATRPAPVLSGRRETPSLAELLGQRQPISPVSERVTAPFQMPKPPLLGETDILGGLKVLGQGLATQFPTQVLAKLKQLTQGGSQGASVRKKDENDYFIAYANEQAKQFVKEKTAQYGEKRVFPRLPIKITDIAQLPQNLAYSAVSGALGAGAGAPFLLIPGAGGWLFAGITGGVSGKIAFDLTSYEIMQQYLEMKDAESRAAKGRGITLAEEKQLKAGFESEAAKYGLWEAIPEGVSNLAGAKLVLAPLTKMFGGVLTKSFIPRLFGATSGEFLTETITQKGQAGVEVRAGMRENIPTWFQAFKEIAPQTALLLATTGGAGATVVGSVQAISSLRNEIGDGHPLFSKISTAIQEALAEERGGIGPLTPESVALKIAKGKVLSKAEEQLRANNPKAIETLLNQLKATGEVTAPVTPEVTIPKPVGRETVAYGPDPTKSYGMRYRLVELDDLVTSHTDAFTPNPAYPQELQPRLRERGAGRLAVTKMARDLVPEGLIQDSNALDRGPMIVGADNVVESGNGRTMALRLAQQSYPEKWQAYQRALNDALPQFGIDPAQVSKMRNPVLVRERLSDVDRVQFTSEANQPAVAVFSPLENALQDSRRIRFDNLVIPEETQSIDATLRMAGNRSFVASFLETLPANESASLLDTSGELNLQGMQRIKAAMFARTYPGEAGKRLTRIFFESREPLIRNVEEGMLASLPKMARAEDLVRSGVRSADLTIAEDLAKSLDMLAILKQRKLTSAKYADPVDFYLSQSQLFTRELTPFQEKLLQYVNEIVRSPKKVREFLGNYADAVIASPPPQQQTMMGVQRITKEDLFNATIRREQEGDLFATAKAPVISTATATPIKPELVAKAPAISQAPVAPAEQVIPKAEAAPEAAQQVVKAEPAPAVPAKPQAGKVPPVKTPPPDKPPTGVPPPPTANDLPSSITPGPMASNIIGLRTIEPGLVRSELLGNIIKRTVSKGLVKAGIQPFVEADPLANPAMRERFRVKTAIESQSALIGAKSEQAVQKAFIFDKKGRIPDLKGINPDIDGAPTIQDVAARLPTYEASLTEEQKTALTTLRGMIEPYHSLMTEVGIEIPQRPDVMTGGFYLPRGRAAIEGTDAPVKIRAGLGKGTKKGFERPAYFTSQSEGIEKGYEYAPLGDALSSYAYDAGVRATDAHIVNYFKALTDETGALIGETPKMRLLRQSPELAQKMETLKGQLDKLKRLSGALTERQLEVIDLWQHDPEFDDLDILLKGLASMRGGKKPGYTGSELAFALKEAKESIRSLQPEYKVALRRAQITPREQGTIGLPGLQGRTYPDEIANAANMVLSKEGRTTGALAPAVNVANAFNNLYRGLRATLDDSALGIQGLLGIGAQGRAYKEALKVNIRAWGVGGDKILGKFIEDFDAKAAATRRLSSSDWAKAELHLGGIASEFQLGQGFSTKLANLPVVRQANRAFGYFGDALRLDWADGELATQLRKHTLEELQAKGDLERIANAANNMTGWAKGKAFGSVGDLLLFAPRFLQSRLETLTKAGAGLRPNATIDQKMTRNTLLRLIGWGTLLTLAVNEMLGNDTDVRPVVDGKRNSNFMRINYQGRKYTVFGTWDSLLGMIINVGTGRPLNAVRSMSSGMVTGAWDVLTGRDYNYNAVRDTPANFAKWLMGSFVPFAAQDIPAMAKGAVQGVKTGEVEKVIGGGIGIGTQLVGVKSYEVSPTYELKQKWADDFKTYDEIPTGTDEAKAQKKPTRTQYRNGHPTTEAKLFITGQINSVSTDMAIDAVIKLVKENKIDPDTIPGVTANKEKRAKRRELGLPPSTTMTQTDKLVSRLNKLGETPVKSEPVPPAITPRKLKNNPFRERQ